MNALLFRLLGELVFQYHQLPHSPGHWRLVKWLRKHEPDKLSRFGIQRNGFNWECDLKFGYYDRDLFYKGLYEPESTRLIQRVLKSGNVAVDVGANIGYFSVILANTVGLKGKVFAFEPSSRFFSRLCRSISLNKMETQIVAEQLALSDIRGNAILHTGKTTASLVMQGPQFDSYKEKCCLTTLDSYWFSMDDPHQIHFLKLDVDGLETKVLLGSQKVIERFKPAILVEVCPYVLAADGSSADSLMDLIKNMGYNQFMVPGKTTYVRFHTICSLIDRLDVNRFDFLNVFCIS